MKNTSSSPLKVAKVLFGFGLATLYFAWQHYGNAPEFVTRLLLAASFLTASVAFFYKHRLADRSLTPNPPTDAK